MDIFQKMAEKWPSEIVARTSIKKFTGGGLSGKTLANFDAQGKGPGCTIIVGRTTCYEKDALVRWLRERAAQKAGER